METFDYVILAFGAVMVLAGIAGLVTKKVYLLGSAASKYTEESLKKFAIPQALQNLVCGAGLVLDKLLTGELFKIGGFTVTAGIAALVVCLIVGLVIYFASKHILVKK